MEIEIVLAAVGRSGGRAVGSTTDGRSLRDSLTVAGGRAGREANPDWDKVLELAEFHGTIPQLQQHLARLPEGSVPAAAQQTLADRCRGIAAKNLLLTRRLTEACTALEGAGIRVLAFKGPTLAILGYGDLSLRQFNDIDVLISPADFQHGLETVRQLGYDFGFRITPSQQIQYERAMGQVALRDAQGTLLELHTKLTDRAYHFPLDFEALWSARQPVVLQDYTLHTLGNEELLLYLAAHGTKHAWPCLGWVLDLSRLVTRNADTDWSRVLQRATAMRCRRILLLSLALARETLELELPAALSEACRADRVARRLAAERTRRLLHAHGKESGLRLAPFHLRSRDRLRDGVSFLWATIFSAHLTDWRAINLPSGWEFLYPIARPLRLVLKYFRPTTQRR